MALVLKNRVKETTNTTGTGAVVMAGAASGFQTFASALADGDTTYYQITDGTDWEIGLGTWDEPNAELTRTTVYESSNSNSAVNWGAGSKDVFIVMPAQKVHNTDVYGQISDLPLTGNSAGDQAYVTANNKLYIWTGSGWYVIAAVNQTPTISGNSSTYVLASDGTATVVTLTGTDPEGFALTWSATTSGTTAAATVTNVDNVFTITPSTNTADAGTLNVTFSASDGVNTATAASSFTLSFVSWNPNDFTAASHPANTLYGANYGGIGREGSIWVSEDGYNMALTGRNTTPNTAYSFSLSTPFDITSSNLTQLGTSTMNSRVSYGGGMWFADDGLTFMVAPADGSKKIYEYTLSTAFNLSTLSTASEVTHTMTGGTTYVFDMGFSTDGLTFWEIDAPAKKIDTYSLTTAYDLTTRTIVQNGVTTTTLSAIQNSIWLAGYFSRDGSKWIVLHLNPSNAADEQWSIYNVTSAFDVSTISNSTLIGTASLNFGGSYQYNGMAMPDGEHMYYFDRSTGYFKWWYV